MRGIYRISHAHDEALNPAAAAGKSWISAEGG